MGVVFTPRQNQKLLTSSLTFQQWISAGFTVLHSTKDLIAGLTPSLEVEGGNSLYKVCHTPWCLLLWWIDMIWLEVKVSTKTVHISFEWHPIYQVLTQCNYHNIHRQFVLLEQIFNCSLPFCVPDVCQSKRAVGTHTRNPFSHNTFGLSLKYHFYCSVYFSHINVMGFIHWSKLTCIFQNGFASF